MGNNILTTAGAISLATAINNGESSELEELDITVCRIETIFPMFCGYGSEIQGLFSQCFVGMGREVQGRILLIHYLDNFKRTPVFCLIYFFFLLLKLLFYIAGCPNRI